MSPFPQAASEEQRRHGRAQRQAALDFIRSHTAEHGWPPTVREVSQALGVSLSTAHVHLTKLVSEGRLERGAGPRQLRVTAHGAMREP